MHTQALGQTGAHSLRQGVAPGPLGTAGNLQFGRRQGGTAGVGRVRATLSNVRRPLSNLYANLRLRFNRTTLEAWQQRDLMNRVHDNSRHVANLLGSLTAPPANARAQSRAARELEQLSRLTQGDLANLPGALEALFAYVDELRTLDLEALRNGTLGSLASRSALLNLMSTDLHFQASDLLNQIVRALNQRLARDAVQAPLSRIRELVLQVPFVAARELAAGLIALPAAPAMLEVYFGSLPQSQVEQLSRVFDVLTMHDARNALQRLNNGSGSQRAIERLESIRQALGREIHARVQPALRALDNELFQARFAGNQRAVSEAFCELDALVAETRRAYGWLPDGVAESASRLVNDNLSVFRDTEHNPHGALSAASLDRLDPVVVENLRNASWGLRGFGLELEGLAGTSWRLF